MGEPNSSDLRLDAFNLSNDSRLSKKVYSAGDDFYIFLLLDKKEPDMSQYEDRKEEIRQAVLSRRISNVYSDWISSFRKKAEIIPNVNLFPNQG